MRMKKFTLLWMAVIFVSSIAFSQNLVVNPSFENWTDAQPDNWLADGGAITVTQNSDVVQEGSSSCHVLFTSQDNQYLTSDAFSVNAGDPFVISFYVNDNDAAGRARLCCIWEGADNYYGDYSEDMDDWQMISYEGVVPDGATSAEFQIRFYDVSSAWDGDAEVYVDMASFVVDNEIKPEPSNYPTDFAAAASGVNANVSWTDATGDQLPQGYLILASDSDSFDMPVDGTPQEDDTDLSDGSAMLNVNFGEEMGSFSSLSPASTYYFAIFPYTNSGNNIDYKTDGSYPTTSLTTPDVSILSSVDFEDETFGDWTTVSVLGDQEWGISSYGNPGNCAYMSGYDGQPYANEDWVISPAFNFDNYSQETFVFDNATKFDGPEMQLFVSTDYVDDPTTATWTELDYTLSTGDWEYVSSGEIDLSSYSGTVNIGFKYTSTDGGSAAWEIDNMLVTAVMSSSIDEIASTELKLYPNPGYGVYQLSNPNKEQLSIAVYNVMGQFVQSIDADQSEITIDLTNQESGVYLLQVIGNKTNTSISLIKK
jgi:hypothetical protein